jgi:U3 small nucleolar RNA-associated protein 7
MECKGCVKCGSRRKCQCELLHSYFWRFSHIACQVYTKPSIQTPHSAKAPPPLYLTHPIPHRPLTSVRFCPFQDILTIGHNAGLSSILVPGVGEPNFDSTEADPFENKKARREREVKGLLDKVSSTSKSLLTTLIQTMYQPRFNRI